VRGRGDDLRRADAGDVEPVDLEPVDPAELRIELDGRYDTRRDDRRRVALIGVVVAVAAAFTAAALLGRVHHARRAAPRPAPVPTTSAEANDGSDRVTRLVGRLGRYWPDGEAMVMDGRLYVSRAHDLRPVVVPDMQGFVGDQSGSSLLISTFPELLVATQPQITSHALSPRSIAVRAAEPGEWWILSDNGALRDTVSGAVLYPPNGLRVAAAVPHGFIALDVRRGRWVLWTGAPVPEPIVDARAQLVAAQGTTAVFRSDCTINGCALEIYDLTRRSAIDAYLPGVPEFAAPSPTGSRLALASTLGDVFLMNPANGALIARSRSRVLPTLSSPIAWSSDGQHLIVVEKDSVEVRNADNGAVTEIISRTAGLEQLAGLP
jgi:hypothetical protein